MISLVEINKLSSECCIAGKPKYSDNSSLQIGTLTVEKSEMSSNTNIGSYSDLQNSELKDTSNIHQKKQESVEINIISKINATDKENQEIGNSSGSTSSRIDITTTERKSVGVNPANLCLQSVIAPQLFHGRKTAVATEVGGKAMSILELKKFVSVAIFSYLGVLARVLLTATAELNPNFAKLGSGFFLPNLVGSAVMGFVLGLGTRMTDRWPSLTTGICSGFCGSCTTFATWIAMIVKGDSMSNWVPGLIEIGITFTASQVGFKFGGHLGKSIDHYSDRFDRNLTSNRRLNKLKHNLKTFNDNAVRVDLNSVNNGANVKYVGISKISFHIAVFIAISLTSIVWILLFLDPSNQRRKWWVAVAFGPAGACMRFWLSLFNRKFPNFPIFTFIVNIFACLVDVCLYIGDSSLRQLTKGSPSAVSIPMYSQYEFWVLSGVSTGTMGSLSTVSTWLNELNQLAEKRVYLSYRYGVVTIVSAYGLSWVAVGIWMGLGHRFY